MQTHNVNVPITVTGRHLEVTEPLRDYVCKKIEGLPAGLPAHHRGQGLLDFHTHRHRQECEIILYCADHLTIEASSESQDDMYAAIDDTISKIARRMRKHKTRLQKHARPRHNQTIRHIQEQVFDTAVLDTTPRRSSRSSSIRSTTRSSRCTRTRRCSTWK